MVIVNGTEIAVDIYVELEPYLSQFDSYRIREDKLQSCSPFRPDRHPSFAVNLENGTWIDSGGVGSLHKGNFVMLLSYLRNESTETVSEYLLNLYSLERREISSLKLDTSWLAKEIEIPYITKDQLKQYAFRHSYLAGRGISEEVQRMFRIGYDKDKKAVVMPHTDSEGNIVNIKFRSVNRKQFWYANNNPVKNYLYGLNQCIQYGATKVWIVESEIDCMKLWTNGVPAIALGTAHCSWRQLKILLSSQIETVVIATDNDEAGKECAEFLKKELVGKIETEFLEYPSKEIKDIGDMDANQIAEVKLRETTLRLNLILSS